MDQKSVVNLPEAEREHLAGWIGAGTESARRLTHARMLVKADRGPGGPGGKDSAIAAAVEVSQSTISRVRQR